jgi:serine/threonine-protein kinase
VIDIGTQIGPYQVLGRIGRGGMGEVFRARDTRLDRDVAIKIMTEPAGSDTQRLARFEREVKAVAALSHPNILAIHDCGAVDGVPFAVMELLVGETLRQRLARGAIAWRPAVELALGVAEGLAAAHAKGIVHRDLKPENLFLTHDDRPKILDFGLVRLLPTVSTSAETMSFDPDRTVAGTVLGTVGYMSPEHVRGREADGRSDIFSFGCVLYEMVTGHRLFRRDTAAETQAAILRDPPPQLTSSGPAVPLELSHIVVRCLEKSPEARFQSAHDLAFALRLVMSNTPPATQIAVSTAVPRRKRRATLDSLAVLPFANGAADPNVDYLSDGITEGLINQLSQIPRLRVMARSTAFRYKGRDVDPRAAGRELGVRGVVTGRVLQVAGRIAIHAELVDVSDGSQVWGEQYSREPSELFSLQQAISREIADTLRLRLTKDQKRRLEKCCCRDTEAYRLYLMGRHQWNKRTAEGIKKAIAQFQQAIDRDPAFALAYAGLADSYGVLSAYADCSPQESMPIACRTAQKALELDPDLAEAHATLGYCHGVYEWDWPAAEAAFRRAIELNPGYANTYHWYAYLLAMLGRFDECFTMIRRAEELDPLSLIINANAGLFYCLARQPDECIARCRKTLALDEHFDPAYHHLGVAYGLKGMQGEALAAYERMHTLSADSPDSAAILAYGHARAGEIERACAIRGQLIGAAASRYISSYAMALLATGLGQTDQAFACLEQAYTDRGYWMIWLGVDPRLDPLRSDARFGELRRRMKL